jgi:hypothetical protein
MSGVTFFLPSSALGFYSNLITNNTNTTGRIYVLANKAQGIVEKHGVVFLGYTRTWAGLFIFISRNVFGSGVWVGMPVGCTTRPIS